ncbi:Uncharacterized protein PECH_003568 [Penicillium ucsense]|uniref:Uncharacterized protein n=1 Tax=Penicillium ucsense TaxID=2839758 RepID=A0A8J8VVY0_9EURO|nr:Uncharacterized protein PECM_003395 [Penicillium ucsense]KAF7729397.1 Uncharacterized protein PECH_003568 [Penicillium ucsense]
MSDHRGITVTEAKEGSMPSTDHVVRKRSRESESRTQRSDSASYKRAAESSSAGRASGELEGSTLESSSREGDRRTKFRRSRQTPNSFLVDYLPPPRGYGFERLYALAEKARHDSHDNEEASRANVPQRAPYGPSQATHTDTSDRIFTPESPTDGNIMPSGAGQGGNASPLHQESGSQDGRRNASPAMDPETVQLVKMALSLSESRKRATYGQSRGFNRRVPLYVARRAPGPIGQASGVSSGNYGSGGFEDSSSPQSPVSRFLPFTVGNDEHFYECTEGTLKRAERARRHFELFHEFMRLLPLLPPLSAPVHSSGGLSSSNGTRRASGSRTYNPLQTIRNRKVRYREKSSIDAEAAGWLDVHKIHKWVDSIEAQYGDLDHDEMQVVKLPSLRDGRQDGNQGSVRDFHSPVSPPASLRHISRTNSLKTNRPRLDWTTSPAELLADVLWLESVANRAKIVDKDGNKLYPDPSRLFVTDTKVEHTRSELLPSVEVAPQGRERPASRGTSSSHSRAALEAGFKSVGRGRHRHRFHGQAMFARGHSPSSSPKRSRWDKVKMRSESTASESSREHRKSSERSHGIWSHSRKKSEAITRKDTTEAAEARQSRSKSRGGLDGTPTRNSEVPDVPYFHSEASHAGRQASVSSAGSWGNRNLARASLEAMDSTAPNSPAHASYFPSIAVKLSPPSSRSPSPAKRGLRHKIASRHERSKSKHDPSEFYEDEDLGTVASKQPNLQSEHHAERLPQLQPSPLPDIDTMRNINHHTTAEAGSEDSRDRKVLQTPESKLRGILKGPGRIAGKVGNEVSKVGDFILKKDTPHDIRKSSAAVSDNSSSEGEESRGGKRSGAKALLRRLPGSLDDSSILTRRETEKSPSKPILPNFTSSTREIESNAEANGDIEGGASFGLADAKGRGDEIEEPKRFAPLRSKTIDFASARHIHHYHTGNSHTIKDPSVPFSLTNPPVTGLARARASPRPADQNDAAKADTGRSWSISERSICTSKASGLPGKTEVERTLALLLSSGIKAREINRRFHSSRDPPRWLLDTAIENGRIPKVDRIDEFDAAVQNLLRRFEMTQYSFQNSMHHFSTATSAPLRSQLKELESVVNETLTPRVRALADNAEDLCVQLNTTSTLAVKSLSDALDKGIRKRRRRLRWARRATFVVLEWTLVGILWWVWLIVVAFKFLRGVCRGAISGVRWVLWI